MNKIPRKFNFIVAKFLSGNCKNVTMLIEKDAYGWHGRDMETGELWAVLPSILRNPDACEIIEIV